VDQLDDYVAAWNESSDERRRVLLARSVMPDVEVIHPAWGRSVGVHPLMEHIKGYRSAMPATSVVLASGLDSHNNVARYAWKIIEPPGDQLMEGVDVVDFADDGRLQRIVLFHASLPAR
jgi:hypothetical protein